MFGKYCCTYIPNNTAHDGSFSAAMGRLEKLRGEVHENAGKGGLSLDGLSQILGQWGAILAKAAISAAIVLIVIFFLTCCIVPMLKRQCHQMMDKQLNVVMGLQKAHMLTMATPRQQAQIHLALQGVMGNPDRFPIPQHLDDSIDTEVV